MPLSTILIIPKSIKIARLLPSNTEKPMILLLPPIVKTGRAPYKCSVISAKYSAQKLLVDTEKPYLLSSAIILPAVLTKADSVATLQQSCS